MATAPISKDESENVHKLVEDAYNKISHTYQTLFTLRPTSTRIRYIQELANDLQPGSHVLELGCGGGLGSKPFVDRGCQITAVDISAAQISLARENIPTATLIHDDMVSVNFAPETFDAVVAMYSLLHLKKAEQDIMMERIVRWLKNGGFFVCNFPANPEAVGGFQQKWLGESMFFEPLGVEGNRKLVEVHGNGLQITQDEVIVDDYDPTTTEAVGESGETFHWIRAIKHI